MVGALHEGSKSASEARKTMKTQCRSRKQRWHGGVKMGQGAVLRMLPAMAWTSAQRNGGREGAWGESGEVRLADCRPQQHCHELPESSRVLQVQIVIAASDRIWATPRSAHEPIPSHTSPATHHAPLRSQGAAPG